MTPQYIYISEDGDKFYHKDKEMTSYHREDGPAIEYADGSKDWYLNGKRHREDGPAMEFANGNKYWYLSNVYYSEQDFLKLTDKETILTMDEIAAKFGIKVSKLKIVK
jgi:hypothetical protein